MASDNGVPARTAFEILTLSLDRNEFTPQWLTPNANANYRASTSVLENVGFNTNIFDFQAADQDIVSVKSIIKIVILLTNSEKNNAFHTLLFFI